MIQFLHPFCTEVSFRHIFFGTKFANLFYAWVSYQEDSKDKELSRSFFGLVNVEGLNIDIVRHWKIVSEYRTIQILVYQHITTW